MKASYISGIVLLALAFPALAWELKPADGIVWTPPPGQAAESNALSATAAFLGDTLSRMAGRTVAVARADAPAPGIHLVVHPPAGSPSADEVFSGRLEAYTIEATNAVLLISGQTAVGVRNGVMAFLHRQGCRWLVPSPKWWIIPRGGRIVFEGREEGSPSFANRRIWYAYGTGDDTLTRQYQVWADANRLGGAALFQTGHSYGNIVDRNKAAFAAHPEYYALRQAPSNAPAADPVEDALAEKENAPAHPVPPSALLGNRDILKFCLSNPGLRALCLADRIALLKAQRAANPLAFMVSMDPSDGPGSCECPDCKKLGSTTDRVVSLANHVARGLREAVPGGWVGMYAYALHREPPAIAMESNIHVQVAMAFNHTAFSYDDLIRLWGEKAGSLGIREYYGVEAWDFGLPGRIRGANPDYHKKRIPQYRAARAVSVNAESNDNWGGQGPGFYVAARLLWNADDDAEAARADYMRAAFGSAAAPMGELYTAFATDTNVSPAAQSRLYDLAYKGLEAAGDQDVRARIVDVIAYLNYVHLFARFEPIELHTEPYYAALETLMNYAHRIQSRSMVAAYALARRLCNGNVKGKKESFWMFGEKPVWKHDAPYTDDEILAMAAGIRDSLKTLPR